MKFTIKHRFSGEVLFSAETESFKLAVEAAVRSGSDLRWSDLSGSNLSGSDLRGSNLRGSDLRGSDLSGSDLRGSDLSGSDLRGSDLSGSNLRGSDLRGSDLRGSKGINKYLTTPLYGMIDQHDPLIAYKLVTADGTGPFNGGITYYVGNMYEVTDADTNETNSCGAGINLASLDWCLRHYQRGFRILIAEFHKADIAAIPIGSDGKFRVHRCRIVGEKQLPDVGLEAQK